MRLVVGIGQRQVGAAGADVEHQQRTALLRHAADLDQRGAPEDLGFLARDQRFRPGQKFDAEECLPLGEVRERDPGLFALDEPAQPLEARVIERGQCARHCAIGGNGGAAGRAPQGRKQPLRSLFGLVWQGRPEALDLLQEVAEPRRGGDLHPPGI